MEMVSALSSHAEVVMNIYYFGIQIVLQECIMLDAASVHHNVLVEWQILESLAKRTLFPPVPLILWTVPQAYNNKVLYVIHYAIQIMLQLVLFVGETAHQDSFNVELYALKVQVSVQVLL